MWLPGPPEHLVLQLSNLLAGYSCALRRYEIHENEVPPFWAFSNWIAWRLRRSSTDQWASNILKDCDEESRAIHRFFTLLDEYRQRRWEMVASLNLRHDQPRPAPLEIRLIQLLPDPVFFFLLVYRHKQEYRSATGHSIESNQDLINEQFDVRTEKWR